MYAVKAIGWCQSKPTQPVPVKGHYEVVITFLNRYKRMLLGQPLSLAA